ncbi:hypothetical protein ACZ87_03804 [Candidatus Erwinia dacicola]|uniref:Uncharacterized protein n=1 Tax=Candidatus Erwinia dacicola TaxID=252393 RepID=A0A328TKG8_9GAMM|nr:hypothetical protein ACZ87_03804 [Candidatus Erwinia dacicola]
MGRVAFHDQVIRKEAIQITNHQAGGELYQQLPHRGKRYSYSAENLKRGLIPNCVGIEHQLS